MGRTNVFTYSNPSVIYWSAGSVAQPPEERERREAPRVAVVTRRSLLSSLDRLPMPPVATVTVGQHAPMTQVRAGVEDIGLAGARAIVSFGGGSAIDAAKIISVDLADGAGKALAHIAIPTTLSVAARAVGARS